MHHSTLRTSLTLACLTLAASTAYAAPASPAEVAFNPSMAATAKALMAHPGLKALRETKGATDPAAKAEALKRFKRDLGGEFEDLAASGIQELTYLPGFDQATFAAFAALPAPRTQMGNDDHLPRESTQADGVHDRGQGRQCDLRFPGPGHLPDRPAGAAQEPALAGPVRLGRGRRLRVDRLQRLRADVGGAQGHPRFELSTQRLVSDALAEG